MQTAVDMEHDARNEGVADQKRYGVGDLLGAPAGALRLSAPNIASRLS
jgi:hypothetical protein